jgi:hypothetical protein
MTTVLVFLTPLFSTLREDGSKSGAGDTLLPRFVLAGAYSLSLLVAAELARNSFTVSHI